MSSRRPEDPCRDPASEARDDWADAPYEVSCIRYDRVTGRMLTLLSHSEEETRAFFDHSKDFQKQIDANTQTS